MAHFVEVPDELTPDLASQVRQVLAEIDTRLTLVGSDRTRLLQVLIYLADLSQIGTLNEQWDAWVPEGHAPPGPVFRSGWQRDCWSKWWSPQPRKCPILKICHRFLIFSLRKHSLAVVDTMTLRVSCHRTPGDGLHFM